MNRNLRISLLGLGSVAAVAAPVALAVSCGDSSQSQGRFNIEDGTLDVGLELAYAPYNFIVPEVTYNQIEAEAADANNEIAGGVSDADAARFIEMIAPTNDGRHGAGIDVYVANRMAQALSTTTQPVTVVLHQYEWDALIPSMTTREEFDAIIAGMTSTPERREQISFTDSYLDAENVVLYTGSTAPTFQSLSGQKIAVQQGTLQETIAREIFGINNVVSFGDATLVEDAVINHVNGINYAVVENVRAAVAKSINPELHSVDDMTQIFFGEHTSGNNIGIPKTTPESTVGQLNTAIAGITTTQRSEMLQTASDLAVLVGE